jgi:phosphatidylglycerol:prolipoprotein diacylglycerol transferase
VDPNKLLDLSIVLLISGLLGARLLHVLADGSLDYYIDLCLDPLRAKGQHLPRMVPCTSDQQCIDADKGELCNLAAGTCHQAQDCFRALKIWYGGLAFYGGLFLCVPVGIWYIHKHRARLHFWKVADLAGFGIPLGLVFGRLGCWFSGCCFGQVSDSACAVTFPRGSPAWERHIDEHLITRAAEAALPVLPAQLMQAGVNLVMFVICFVMWHRWRRFDGIVFASFLALKAIGRFGVEYYRDDYRGVWLDGTLSTSQLLGIPMLIAAVVLWFVLSRRRPSGPPTPPEAA